MKKLLLRGLLALLLTFLAVLVYVEGRVYLHKGDIGTETNFKDKSALLKSPPAGLKAPITLKVVTFNIQDTWVVGQDRPERMRAIGTKLSLLDPDLVGFQEAFIEEDMVIMKEELKETRLKHWQYYPSGAVGSGVYIASVWPIKEVFFHQYTVAGPWWKIWEGDGAAGKGVGLARIELPEGQGYIDLFNTHAQAGYGNLSYEDPVRVTQLTELADFVNGARLPTCPTLLTGDFNSHPDYKSYKTMVERAKLERLMTTEDSRIDHIFAVKDPAYKYEVLNTERIYEKWSIRGKELELSDHSGWISTIRITPAPRP